MWGENQDFKVCNDANDGFVCFGVPALIAWQGIPRSHRYAHSRPLALREGAFNLNPLVSPLAHQGGG